MRLWKFLALSVFMLGCSNASDDGELIGAEESIGTTEDALTGNRAVGATLRTTTGLNLRAGAGTGYAILVTMPQGANVTVRQAAPVNGWYAVRYGSTDGWASGSYLVDAAPPPPSSGPSVRIGGPAVRAHVQGFANAACTHVGGCPYDVGTYNGHQPTADRAIDLMMSPAGTVASGANQTRGTSIADFGLANAPAHRVDYVIWRQRINTIDGRGWRWMADRGSITQNHYDHVHVSFDP